LLIFFSCSAGWTLQQFGFLVCIITTTHFAAEAYPSNPGPAIVLVVGAKNIVSFGKFTFSCLGCAALLQQTNNYSIDRSIIRPKRTKKISPHNPTYLLKRKKDKQINRSKNTHRKLTHSNKTGASFGIVPMVNTWNYFTAYMVVSLFRTTCPTLPYLRELKTRIDFCTNSSLASSSGSSSSASRFTF
jgi:hypothetical protein